MAKTISLQWANAKTGEFVRQTSSFRSWIGAKSGFPAEPGRYHLYVSHACPWAHRTLLVRALKGLEEVIGVSVVDPFLDEQGWKFSSAQETPGCVPDTVNGFRYVRELYLRADPEYNARFTVPVLWDCKSHTIVNNESSEIIRMLNGEFNAFAKNPQLDLYPADVSREIDEVNAWVYDSINNGVYKSGFATSQEAYEKSCRALFQGLDRVEEILRQQPYLAPGSKQWTEADVRLFTTMVRFDPVYHGHFKCNVKTVQHGYPAILAWMRRFYQFQYPLVAQTVHMEHIKNHYYRSHIKINPTRIVPLGNGPDLEPSDATGRTP